MRSIAIAELIDRATLNTIGYRLLRLPEDDKSYIIGYEKEVIDITVSKAQAVLQYKTLEIINLALTKKGRVKNRYYSIPVVYNNEQGNSQLQTQKLIALSIMKVNGKNDTLICTTKTGEFKGIKIQQLSNIGKYTILNLDRQTNKIVGPIGSFESPSTNRTVQNDKIIKEEVGVSVSEAQKEQIQVPVSITEKEENNRNSDSSNKDHYETIIVTDLFSKLKGKNRVTDEVSYDKLGRLIEPSEIMDKQLQDVPPRLVRFWGVKEFKEYMDKHGYYLDMEDTTIYSIDRRLKVLVVPRGTWKIAGLKDYSVGQNGVEPTVETIYLNKELVEPGEKVDVRWATNLKTLFIDESAKEFNFRSFYFSLPDTVTDRGLAISVPKHIEELNGFNLYSVLPKDLIDSMSNNQQSNESPLGTFDFSILPDLKKLKNSFNEHATLDGVYTGNIEYMEYSLCNLCGGTNGLEITIGESMKTIGIHSFTGVFNTSSVDFSRAINLEEITESVLNNVEGDLYELDLSMCQKLHDIGSGSISKIKNLVTLKLPDSVISIGRISISNCFNLVNLNLPKNLTYVGTASLSRLGITRLTIPSPIEISDLSLVNTDITIEPVDKLSKVYPNMSAKSLTISEGTKEIGQRAFVEGRFELSLPESLEKIGKYAFYSANINPDNQCRLDLRKNINLREIGEGAFLSSGLEDVVLPDGITTIREKAFSEMKSLKNIYLPGSITKLETRIFVKSGINNSFGITFFVQKGSTAARYAARQKDAKVVYVDNADEVVDILDGNVGTNKTKLNKLQMVLGANPEYTQLFDGKYKAGAPTLVELKGKLDTKVAIPDVAIDASNMINVPEHLAIPMIITRAVETRHVKQISNRKFIALCNYITTAFDRMDDIVSQKFVDNVYNKVDETLKFNMPKGPVIRLDKIIIKYRLISSAGQIFRLALIEDYNTIYITYIIIGGKVRYVTADRSQAGVQLNSLVEKEGISDKDSEMNTPAEQVINFGNSESVRRNISEDWIPRDMVRSIDDIITRQCELIAINCSREQKSKLNGIIVGYLYNLYTGRVIKVNIKYMATYGDEISTNNIKSLEYLEDYPICSTPEEDKKFIRDWASDTTGIKGRVEKITFGDEYVSELANRGGAYDKPEPCYEWQLSKALNNAGAKRVEQLTEQSFEILTKTKYFFNATRDTRKMVKRDIEYQLADGTVLEVFVMPRGRNQTNFNIIGNHYRYFICKAGENSKFYRNGWLTSYHLNEIFSQILAMYVETASKEVAIDNSFSGTYKPIGSKQSIGIASHEVTEVEFELGISKGSGCIFLLGIVHEMGGSLRVIKLLRFRNMAEALEATAWLADDTKVNGIKESAKSFAQDLAIDTINIGKSAGSNFNRISRARELVMNGYPNGFYTDESVKYFFDLAAKQRK